MGEIPWNGAQRFFLFFSGFNAEGRASFFTTDYSKSYKLFIDAMRISDFLTAADFYKFTIGCLRSSLNKS